MKNERLIASTMTYRCVSAEYALTRLFENGFSSAELCTVSSWVPHFDLLTNEEIIDAKISELANTAKRIGIRIHAVNCGNGNVNEKGDFISDALAKANNAMRLAKGVGAEIVTFSCGNIKPEENRKAKLKAIASFNKVLADMADFYGVTLSIEAPHKLSIAESYDEIMEYWSIQDERVKCTLDDAHLTYSGQNPSEIAKILAPRVVHVHLRDAVKGNSLLRYGEGEVDFASFIGTLKECGYKGMFSMEYPSDSLEDAEDRIVKSTEFFSKLDI